MQDHDAILLETRGRIAYLWLNAPPRNEMSTPFFSRLGGVISVELPSLDVDGVIIAGKERHFSSGADLAHMGEALQQGEGFARFLAANSESVSRLASLPFPVVAAINGVCLGAGLELALACSKRVASRQAVLGLPEATFGLMPGWGGTIRLTKLIGRSRAIELILSGKTFGAEDALEYGVVDAVVEKKDLMREAEKMIMKEKS